MAQKINTGRAAGESRAAPWRAWWVVMMVAALALGAVVALIWHRGAATSADQRLPALPDLAGKPAELRRQLTDAQARLRSQPDSPETIAQLGLLYHANGFNAEAAACWRVLHTREPKEAHWPYYLSDLSRIASDEAGLQRWLEKTVELAPDYAPAWLQLGDLAFKGAQFDAAERAYRRRLELTPGDAYAGFGLARVMLQRGQRAEGKRALEELISSSPEFSSAHNFYAEILAQEHDVKGAANQRWLGTVAGQFRAAEDPWLDELRAACYDIDRLLVWGVIDFQTKHGDHGRASLERAFQLDPDNLRALEKLAELYLDEGEAEKARDLLERGRRLPGATETVYFSLFKAYEALRRPADALRITEEALVLMPNSSGLHNAHGLALASADRIEEALAAFRVAITLAPGSPDPVTNFALALLRAGRREEAVVQLKRALELQPQYSTAIIALAQLELEAGDPGKAEQYIAPFFQQFPGSRVARKLMAGIYIARALAAARRGDAAAVEQTCRDGLSLVPESAELYGMLGTHYMNERRWDDALKALEASQRLKPNDPRSTLSLGDLYQRLGRTADARRLLSEGAERAKKSGQMETAARFEQLLQQLPE